MKLPKAEHAYRRDFTGFDNLNDDRILRLYHPLRARQSEGNGIDLKQCTATFAAWEFKTIVSTSKIAVVATPRISSQGFCLRSTAITHSSIHQYGHVRSSDRFSP